MNLSKILFASLLWLSCHALAQTATNPTAPAVFNENNCIDGQDLNAEDINISNCPSLPNEPTSVELGKSGLMIDLGAWEIGQTAEGQTYKYGSLSDANASEPRILTYEDGKTTVNDGNITCWAKGYYRLRKILQNPPADYVKLREHGFQVCFF